MSDLEHELARLKLAQPDSRLKRRILAVALAEAPEIRPTLWEAISNHWLFPGKIPLGALAAVWLVILALKVSTPESNYPVSAMVSAEEMNRSIKERAEIIAQIEQMQQQEQQSREPIFEFRHALKRNRS